MKLRTKFVSNSSSSSFVVVGFEVTDNILKIAREAAQKIENSTEEYLCCSKCGFEPSGKPKFCEKCGGEIHTATRPAELKTYDIFEILGMSYYPESDEGKIAGFSIKNANSSVIKKYENEIKEIFGDIEFGIISGTYYC